MAVTSEPGLYGLEGVVASDFDDDNPDAVFTAPRLPPIIDLSGAAKLPCFEIRLGEMLQGFMKLTEIDVTPTNHEILHAKDVSTWHTAISVATLDQSKHILSSSSCPTVQQLLSLPSVAGEWRPGSYLELILADRIAMASPDEFDYAYIGSASGVGTELEGRAAQHASPTYRASDMKRKPSFHYQIVDQPGKIRSLEYRKLAVTEFPSTAAKDINETRALCIVIEQVMMCWLRGFAIHVHHRNQAFVQLSPWDWSPYLGTNSTAALRQDPVIALQDAPGLTPEARADRHRAMTKSFRSNQTGAQITRTEDYKVMYNKRIVWPREQMRAAGASESDIKAFVQAELNNIHGALPAKTKGSDRRRTPEDILARTEKADLDELDMDDGAEYADSSLSDRTPYGMPGPSLQPLHPPAILDNRAPRKRGPKTGHGKACTECRKNKAKCDGNSPCARRIRKRKECKPQ